jgi:methionyl-tRNA synthetase
MQFAARYFDSQVPPLVADAGKGAEVKSLLANDLQRVVEGTLTDEKALDELVPKYLKYFTRNDLTMLLVLARAPKRVGDLYRAFRFRDAVLETMNVARAANKYFNDSEPWKTRRDQTARCATTINICLQVVRSLAILFEPIIPFSSEKIRQMLNLQKSANDTWGAAAALAVPDGHTVGQPEILFTKFEDEAVEREIAKLGAGAPSDGDAPPIEVELKPEVSIDDVMKLDLRIATVLEAERVKKSDKLIKLQIRIGNLQRQIIAGIGKQYEPEQLVGSRIVVVANLKPAKLMGNESQGMLLAANSPENEPTVVTVIDGAKEVRDGFIVR